MQLFRLASSLVLGAILVGSPLPAAAQSSTPPLVRTKIRMLTPFGSDGLSTGLTVSRQVSGNCFARSASSATRPDAWRCSAGNSIMDPCYQRIMGDEKQLACPADGPWSAKVVLLTLTQPLPGESHKEASRDATLPWALELAGGQHCSLFTGATAPVAGMRINYGCPGGFIVVGDIDRSQPVWRVFFEAEKSSVLEQMDVAVAWF